jgi:hypothetical protein
LIPAEYSYARAVLWQFSLTNPIAAERASGIVATDKYRLAFHLYF